MSKTKLNLFIRVYKSRIAEGETVEEIDISYPALSVEEKDEIHEKLNL